MQSVLEILKKCTLYFEQKGIETPKLDAEILLAHSLGCKRLDLFLRFEEPLPEITLKPFRELVKRRAKREPLQHIIGNVDFFNITLNCDKRALIPRHETEQLCDIITSDFFADSNQTLDILDLGAGSGAIALALASFYKNSIVDAVDFSDDALSLANENKNLLNLNVNIFKSNWFENITKQYDIIVANPPYLTDDEVANAQPEVKDFDPINALVAPDNGLADLKNILSNAQNHLKNNGIIAFECGVNQPTILKELATNLKFSHIQPINDSYGRERFLICRK